MAAPYPRCEPGTQRASGTALIPDLPDTLTWRCSHQVAFCLPGTAAAGAAGVGDLAVALRALELLVDAATRRTLRHGCRPCAPA